MKAVKKTVTLWIARDSYGYVQASFEEPYATENGYGWISENEVHVPCFLGFLGLRRGQKRRVKVTVEVRDAE